jgi:hypothetical protein
MKTPQKTAKVAGALYLMMAPFAIFSVMYVPSLLIEVGDTGATVLNLIEYQRLFRGGIISWLICQVIFIFLVVVLYNLLKVVNKNTALLMLILALVGVPIACINELNRFAALLLLSDADYLTALDINTLHAQAMLFLDLHTSGLYIAQVFWGLWLFPFGCLVFKSGFLPKSLGILLIIGCFGYLADSITFFLFPFFELTVSPITGIGEILFPLWLLFKGINIERWKQHALQSV